MAFLVWNCYYRKPLVTTELFQEKDIDNVLEVFLKLSKQTYTKSALVVWLISAKTLLPKKTEMSFSQCF